MRADKDRKFLTENPKYFDEPVSVLRDFCALPEHPQI
jgi:hypothetical protein